MADGLIELAVLGAGGLSTVSAVLLNWRSRKLSDRKATAEIGIDEATQSKIVRDAAHSVETDYLQRLADFRVDIARLNKELAIERERCRDWRDRLTMFEDFFFTKHMPWDRRMVVAAREHDWRIEDPPSVLDYMNEVQSKIESETKEHREEKHSH